ncbi:MAG: hypothetical protein ABIF10_04960 [Candidatus Woesearchaeota archaeon]
MNLQITEQKKNDFLSRKEVRAVLTYEHATPSKEELKKQVAAAMKANADLLVIRQVNPSYGEQKADVLFYIYEKPDVMKKLEKEKPKKSKEKPQ